MRRGFICFFIMIMVLANLTQLVAQEEKRPVTKLEEMFLLKSSLIIKEFYPIGEKRLPSDVSFKWIVIKPIGKETAQISGLRVEIVDYSRSISNRNAAFLDSEEVKDLIPSIDYMENLINQYKNEPPKTYTEVQFSTKGDFNIGFYCKGKDIKAFMSAGSISPTTSFFGIDKLAEIKAILEEALKSY